MTLRHAVALVLVATVVAACKKKTPPASTVTPTTAGVDDSALRAAREQARRDSIAAAERASRDAVERDRAARAARVRETLSDIVYFEYDSDELTAEAQEKLQTKADILRSNPTLRLQVEGHTDERGSTEYNIALGQRRAETVRDFMTGYGIESGRIGTISYGEERPTVEGSEESAWARNRRAEFAITGGEITNVPQR